MNTRLTRRWIAPLIAGSILVPVLATGSVLAAGGHASHTAATRTATTRVASLHRDSAPEGRTDARSAAERSPRVNHSHVVSRPGTLLVEHADHTVARHDS